MKLKDKENNHGRSSRKDSEDGACTGCCAERREGRRAAGKGVVRGRTSLRGSDVPHGCGGRVDPDDDDRVSGDVRRGRYGAHHRPG